MTIKLIPLGLLAILLTSIAPMPEGPCSWNCHNNGCYHGQELALSWIEGLGLDKSFYFEKLEPLYLGVIHWLQDLPGTYREANLYVYGAIYPGLAMVCAIVLGVRWPWLVLAVGGSLLFVLDPNWYNRCTEFCIYVGNATGLTYVGFNFLLFLILIPGFLLLDLARSGWKIARYIYPPGWSTFRQMKPNNKLK